LNGKFNQGPNLWPEALPEFRATMEQYQWELEGAQLLMQGVALSLGLPEQHFAGFCQTR
jgi:isopenicillin N synthase-like dioxygenase